MTTSEKDLQVMFDLFCQTSKGKGGKLPLEGLKTWFKQAGVTGKASNIKDADIGSAFKNTVRDESGITFVELKELVTNLAKEKKMDQNEIIEKLCGTSTPQPGQTEDAEKKVGAGSV
ncbi:hypothetical protein AVEN_221663-1 [Araneus ventricosus]|uniref:TPPP family protein CG45057 n=1 Tax=Araneus ventricosus TaxID=182803 RepID=A0A4Y2GSA6_ARAVE|nr:hypothetical protein AVEN_221663-1 [Araneus ventricosus]